MTICCTRGVYRDVLSFLPDEEVLAVYPEKVLVPAGWWNRWLQTEGLWLAQVVLWSSSNHQTWKKKQEETEVARFSFISRAEHLPTRRPSWWIVISHRDRCPRDSICPQIIMPMVAKVKIIITCGLEYCPGARPLVDALCFITLLAVQEDWFKEIVQHSRTSVCDLPIQSLHSIPLCRWLYEFCMASRLQDCKGKTHTCLSFYCSSGSYRTI